MDLQQKQEIILDATTPKILSMCQAAKNAGAYGAKQMGAGGGGCIFAICPERQEAVGKAIEEVGGRAWILTCINTNLSA